MFNIRDFDRILKTNATCYILPEIPELRIWMTLKEMMQTCICGEQDF